MKRGALALLAACFDALVNCGHERRNRLCAMISSLFLFIPSLPTFAVPPDQHRNIGLRFGDGVAANVHSNIHRKESHDLNPVWGRIFAMMMRIIYRTRWLRFCATPRPARVMWQRAGRLFAACRATGKTKDATRFRRVGIPSRNVRPGRRGTEWNRPRNRCRHLRFSRNFEAQRRS